MNAKLKGSDISAIVATIDPDAYSAGTETSDYVDMSGFESIQAVIMAGTLGTSATLDAKLVQATDASGAGKKDISGKAITQLTQAGTDSDKQSVINCFAEELDINNSFRYVAIEMTVAVAACDAGAIVLGHGAKYNPASDNDLASVDEIV
jgi:hypothetical protein